MYVIRTSESILYYDNIHNSRVTLHDVKSLTSPPLPFLCCFMWLKVVVKSSFMWLKVAVCGYEWFYVVISGSMWFYVVKNGLVWKWFYVVKSVYMRLKVVKSGVYVVKNGFMWLKVVLCVNDFILMLWFYVWLSITISHETYINFTLYILTIAFTFYAVITYVCHIVQHNNMSIMSTILILKHNVNRSNDY